MPRPGETQAEWLARMRSVGVVSTLSGNKTREFRDPTDGHRVKVIKDEATERGNLVTEHSGGRATGVTARQDVLIRPDAVQTVQAPFKLSRQEAFGE